MLMENFSAQHWPVEDPSGTSDNRRSRKQKKSGAEEEEVEGCVDATQGAG